MAPDHLGSEGLGDLAEVEVPAFARQMGMKHHLKQQISQLVAERGEVFARDRVGDLVGLLDGAGGDRLERLRAVPGTLAAKSRHQLDQALHLFLRRRAAFFRGTRLAAPSPALPQGRGKVGSGRAGGIGRVTPSALLLCLGAATAASAAPDAPPVTPAAIERIMFLEAERALHRGRRGDFERMSEALRGHPLRPWLDYLPFRRNFPRRSEPEIEAFLAAARGTPMADMVRARWLERLARQGRWTRFLDVQAALPPGRLTNRLRCHRARALFETGDDAAGFEAAAALWLVPRSQDEACDPVFTLWVRKDGRTPEHLWDRTGLALRRGNPGLARHVARMLDPSERAVAVRWIRDYRRPARLVSEAHRVSGDPAWRRPVEAAIARLARLDPDAAVRAWRKASDGRALPEGLDAFAAWRIGLGFAQDYRLREARGWFERVPAAHRNPRLLGLLALVSFAEGRWEDCLAALDALPPDARGELRWRYWRARARDALGRDADPAWAEIAAERDYYGFLAADRLGLPYRFRERPAAVSSDRIEAFERGNGFRRALELQALGHRRRFEREWNHLVRRIDPGDLAVAAEAAGRRGWPRKAIEAAARAKLFDRLDLRFPLAWKDEATAAAETHGLDPAWVLAIIRMESAFLPEARSSAGARGLMQLLPETARRIAKAAGVRYAGPATLDDPESNVLLGTAYLRRLLDRVDGHPALASASYNAGPHRVDEWLAESGKREPVLWVDLIPYAETRQYVKRVLEYRIVYRHRLGTSSIRLHGLLPSLPPALD